MNSSSKVKFTSWIWNLSETFGTFKERVFPSNLNMSLGKGGKRSHISYKLSIKDRGKSRTVGGHNWKPVQKPKHFFTLIHLKNSNSFQKKTSNLTFTNWVKNRLRWRRVAGVLSVAICVRLSYIYVRISDYLFIGPFVRAVGQYQT